MGEKIHRTGMRAVELVEADVVRCLDCDQVVKDRHGSVARGGIYGIYGPCPGPRATARKPSRVEAGQIWRRDGGVLTVITAVCGIQADVQGGGLLPRAAVLLEDPAWSCVGVETPYGRVMVGELRYEGAAGDAYTVDSVVHGGTVRFVRKVGETRFLVASASAVAGWRRLLASHEDASAVRTAADLGPGVRLLDYSVWPGEPAQPHLNPFAWLEEPRVVRELAMRAVTQLLDRDARLYPAFATARRAAVVRSFDWEKKTSDVGCALLEMWLDGLRTYEDERGGLSQPRREAVARAAVFGMPTGMLDAYEAARSLP